MCVVSCMIIFVLLFITLKWRIMRLRYCCYSKEHNCFISTQHAILSRFPKRHLGVYTRNGTVFKDMTKVILLLFISDGQNKKVLDMKVISILKRSMSKASGFMIHKI